MLLWHHLFWRLPEIYPYAYQFAILFKVCVSMFLFVSGYGLTISYRKNKTTLKKFYLRRLSKLYETYWVIFTIFIVISILVFNRLPSEVYGDEYLIKMAINFFAVQLYFPNYVGHGYNPTWWFMTLIITLYLLYPFMYNFLKKMKILGLLIMIFISFLSLPVLSAWIASFALGIYIAEYKVFDKVLEYNENYLLLISIIAILTISMLKLFEIPGSGNRLDFLFSFFIIMVSWLIFRNDSIIKNVFVFIGVHSFNIFLFHTFLFKYFFESELYALQNPFVILTVLLMFSIVISILINMIKNYLFKSQL